jgi:hypothetical protein
MSSLSKKILVSGCGLSWSGQKEKTWVNILKSMGADIKDVGGPAVSNQWIINQVITELIESHSYTQVIIQLTSLGKLDVEMRDNREEVLVKNDSLRNFVFKGIWPSSVSSEHESKKLYNTWLTSPSLEVMDIFCKLMLLSKFCKGAGVDLIIFEGYHIPWTLTQAVHLKSIISNFNDPIYSHYENSASYQFHNFANYNSVPCLRYQADIANSIASRINFDVGNKIEGLKQKLQSAM